MIDEILILLLIITAILYLIVSRSEIGDGIEMIGKFRFKLNLSILYILIILLAINGVVSISLIILKLMSSVKNFLL